MNVAEIRELFPGLKDTIYLNTATMAVGCAPASAAYRNAQLSRRLHDALVAHRWAVRPPFSERHRSTIVSVPVDDTEAVMTRLRKANVVASVRGGRVRLSVHFYNLEEEIDRVAEMMGSA